MNHKALLLTAVLALLTAGALVGADVTGTWKASSIPR
jgi:hypothetical protein